MGAMLLPSSGLEQGLWACRLMRYKTERAKEMIQYNLLHNIAQLFLTGASNKGLARVSV